MSTPYLPDNPAERILRGVADDASNIMEKLTSLNAMQELAVKVKTYLLEEGYCFDETFMLEDDSKPSNIYFMYAPAFHVFSTVKNGNFFTNAPYVFIKFERSLSLSHHIRNSQGASMLDPSVNYYTGLAKAVIGRDNFGRTEYDFIIRALQGKMDAFGSRLSENKLEDSPRNRIFFFIASQILEYYNSSYLISPPDEQYILGLVKNNIVQELAFLALHDGIYTDNREYKWSIEQLIEMKDLPLNYLRKLMA